MSAELRIAEAYALAMKVREEIQEAIREPRAYGKPLDNDLSAAWRKADELSRDLRYMIANPE